MAGLNIFEQKDFSGGLNLRADQFQLADNESPSLLNVEIDPRGGIFSRGAMTRINPDNIVAGAWNPQKIYNYSSQNRIMVTTTNRVYYDSTSSNFAVLNHSGGAVTPNSPHGACLAEWGGTMYIATGADATVGGYSWNGSGNATGITRSSYTPDPWQATPSSAVKMPQCEHICVHANKMFAAQTTEYSATGDVHHPNRLRWSLDGIATNWAENDYIDLVGGGDGITGMVSVQGQLVVFKPHAVYVVSGYDTDSFTVAELSTKVGCSDHHSMAASDSGVYFYSKNRGLFYYDGSSLRNIFEPLKPMFDLGHVNTNAEENISVSWVGKRVWLSLPYSKQYPPSNVTVNFVFDPYLNAYTMFESADGYGVIGGTDFRTAANEDFRLMLHPVVPCVLRVDRYGVNSDRIAVDGSTTGFNSYYRTKWQDGGTYLQRKMFRRPNMVLRESQNGQDIAVFVYQDFDEQAAQKTFNITQSAVTGSVWDDDIWGDGTSTYTASWATDVQGSLIYTGKNLGLCYSVQLQFNGPIGYDWGINSIGFKYQPRRVKG